MHLPLPSCGRTVAVRWRCGADHEHRRRLEETPRDPPGPLHEVLPQPRVRPPVVEPSQASSSADSALRNVRRRVCCQGHRGGLRRRCRLVLQTLRDPPLAIRTAVAQRDRARLMAAVVLHMHADAVDAGEKQLLAQTLGDDGNAHAAQVEGQLGLRSQIRRASSLAQRKHRRSRRHWRGRRAVNGQLNVRRRLLGAHLDLHIRRIDLRGVFATDVAEEAGLDAPVCQPELRIASLATHIVGRLRIQTGATTTADPINLHVDDFLRVSVTDLQELRRVAAQF
mmetsp:Transcript_25543/g.73459  ORF Transcript_25543/g.73459 Transcript_25543/m.73459 type:complete len:281 (+) Transcript_25543:2305-3147(+)